MHRALLLNGHNQTVATVAPPRSHFAVGVHTCKWVQVCAMEREWGDWAEEDKVAEEADEADDDDTGGGSSRQKGVTQ